MSTTLLSKFLYVASLIVIIGSIVRWYFIFPDISQLAFGLSGALTLIIGAHFHSICRNLASNQKEEVKVRARQNKELDKALDVAIDYMRDVEKQIK